MQAPKTGSIVFQVHGQEILRIPTSFAESTKGVYGWYVLRADVKKFFGEDQAKDNEDGTSRIHLYIGTVTAKPRRSVAARFVGHLIGPQISSDKNRTLDGDFVMSRIVKFLCERGMNVYCDILSD